MQNSISIPAHEITNLKEKLIEYARENELACILDSNTTYFQNSGKFLKYDLIAGFTYKLSAENSISEYQKLKEIKPRNTHWYLGYLSYDLKNNIEGLHSGNSDHLNWPDLYFFQPDVLFLLANNVLTIKTRRIEIAKLINHLNSFKISKTSLCTLNLHPRMSKNDYISRVKEIQNLIQRGDLYEINFCQEFYNHTRIDPYSVFRIMNQRSPSPFAAFFKYANKFLLSSSPERFLKKENSLIISQPMKGTSAKGVNISEDHKLKTKLSESTKERSENIMIVDLVRNDLSRIAEKNSVKVEELCKIYTYPHVHQMVSTITSQLKTKSFIGIINATFPMGSMTGAPKIAAMKIIEEYESTKRGLYSGSVGYISPGMNFDFNVVIRSLQYNAENKYISYLAGSAITALSDSKQEYQECLTKVYGIINASQKVKYA